MAHVAERASITALEVPALRGPGFRSMQFHPESVRTEDGVDILREVLTALLQTSAPTDERLVRASERWVRAIRPRRFTAAAPDHQPFPRHVKDTDALT